MDGNIPDPDSARERLETWKGRIDKLASETRVMSDRLQQVQVTATDPQGLAEVAIDSTGALVDLQLTDRIQQKPPAAVARTIMATLGEARNKLADQSEEIIADTVGTESAAGRAIAENLGRHFRGGSAPDGPTAPTEGDGDYDISSEFR